MSGYQSSLCSRAVAAVRTSGYSVILLYAAHLHSRLYPGPVVHRRTSCRCHHMPKSRKAAKAHSSRLTTYTYQLRINRMAKCSPSPGMQMILLSARFGTSVFQLWTYAIRSQFFIASS